MDESLYAIDHAPVDAYVNGDMNGGSDPTAPGGDGRDIPDGSTPLDGGGPTAASDIAGLNGDLTDTGTRHSLPYAGDATVADPTASTPSPYDIVARGLGIQNPDGSPPPQPDGSGSPYDIVAKGLATAANGGSYPADSGMGNGRPLTVEEKAFQAANPNGGSFTHTGNGNMTVEQQAFQNANPNGGSFPNLPYPGVQPSAATAPTGSGSGQGADATWAQDFKAANGYYDPTFDSRDAFLHEAQMGDTAIRGATDGGDQLAKMAQYDSDAKRIYDAVKGTPDFYNSQLAADWAKTHNQSVVDQYGQASGQGGGQPQAAQGAAAGGQGYNGRGVAIVDHVNQAVATGNRGQLDWLKSQLVNEVANPIKNTDAFPVAAEIVKDLQTLGVDGTTIHLDNAGTLHFTSASGVPNSFPGDVPLANWVSDLAILKNAIAQRQQPAPQAGSGSSAPRSSGYSAPRSSGSSAPRGNVPPAGGNAPPPGAPAAPQAGQFSYGDVNGMPEIAVNQPFQNPTTPGGSVTRPQLPLVTPEIATMRNNGRPVPY